MIGLGLLRRLVANERGSMAIETAFVTPILILMTLGIYEAGTVVARHHELQSVANESEIIIVATNRGAQTNLDTIKAIVRESVGLGEESVQVSRSYRCGIDPELVADENACAADEVVSTYVNLDISERYTPVWTYFGVGQPITFSVASTVLIS